MPGARSTPTSRKWFLDMFGFKEFSYEDTRANLTFTDGVLESQKNGKRFHIGSFEVLTLENLRLRCDRAVKVCENGYWRAGGLSYENVVSDTRELHLSSPGAVFQVASLFNCLETVGGAEAGVTRYAEIPTQGAAAAMSCPAATVFRNYFVNGHGQANGNALNCLSPLSEHVSEGEREEQKFWVVKQGYCLPRVIGSMARFSKTVLEDPAFAREVVSKVAVGVHWDTEVAGGGHRVCQVFCSALPVGCPEMKGRPAADWAGFAGAVLEAGFDAALTAANLLAALRGARVPVFLTPLGSGELGNRRQWIVDALGRALRAHRGEPLDVRLVHYARVPKDVEPLQQLYCHAELPPEPARRSSAKVHTAMILADFLNHPDIQDQEDDSEAGLMAACFRHFDTDGDGLLDREEFYTILHAINEDVFTQKNCNILFKEADVNDDDRIHYMEFVDWLCREDDSLKDAVIRRGSDASLDEREVGHR